MADAKSHTSRAPVRGRVLALGVLLALVNAYWVLKAEIIRATIHATVLAIFFNVTFTLFVVSLANLAVRRRAPRFALSRGELVVIYAMLASTTGLYGIDLLTLLVPTVGHAEWFATPENEWRELFGNLLPTWLAVGDRDVLRGYYDGESSFWRADTLRIWAIPTLSWSLFAFALMFASFCLNAMVRRQWVHEEKLSYPAIQLPFEMTDATGAFYGNRLMWVGFALSGAYGALRALRYWFPFVPAPTWEWDLAPLLSQRPWNAVNWLPVRIYPFVVGMAFFMPLDLSLSFWFFFLFWKAQLVFRSAVGWSPMPGAYLSSQTSGAWLGIGALALWNSRGAIRRVVVGAFRRSADDAGEPLRHRSAALGFAGAFLFLALFGVRVGMSVWASAAYLVLYLVIVLAATRMRAELGPPAHELHGAEPGQILLDTLGKRPFSTGDLVGFSLFHWTSYAHRGIPAGHELEGLKLADRAGIHPKHVHRAVVLATAFVVPATMLLLLTFFYHYGGTAKVLGYSMGPAGESFERLQRLLTNPAPPDASVSRQRLFGLALAAFLMLMKRRFAGWPLHPVGYAVAAGWTVSWMWFSALLSWGAKTAILRFGGIRLYRRTAPFFLGLILGQFVVGSFWTIWSALFDAAIFRFFP